MTADEITKLITTIATFINSAALIYLGFKKLKPEVKKMSVDTDSEIVDAANMNLEGAKVSAAMLLDRINELKRDLDTEKAARKEEQALNEKLRRDDAEYFRRRIKDLEREGRDYRSWAANLARQVVQAGLIPAPFIPSLTDSETGIQPIRSELENKPRDK